MAYNPWADDAGDDDGQTDDAKVMEERNAKVANAMIIDVRDNMFEKNASDEIPFANCLRACAHQLKNQVICEDTDFVGLYFAGSEHKSADSAFDHIYVFKELAAPTASLIREIDQVLADIPAFRAKLGNSPATSPLPLTHAIWTVNLDLAKRKLKETDTKTIWIFTNDDDPFKGNETMEKQCLQKARDGAEQGQDYILWCMNRQAGVDFDPQKFYASIIPEDEDADETIYNAGDGNFATLMDHIRRKAFKKRVMGRFPWNVGPGINLAVSMYARIMPMVIPTPLRLDAKTNAPLVCKTRWFCEDTTTYLLDHQIKHYIPYGGHQVFVSKDEMKLIKDAGTGNGLTLVGFRPLSSLKDTYNLRTSYFLYPDEKTVKGSTVAFSALQAKMQQHSRFGLAFLSVSKRAPKLVALVPQAEERDEDGFQISPAGINVIVLPYSDDIRHIPGPRQGNLDSDALTQAEALVSTLKLPNFDSVDFENPKIQRHYAGVQALALLEDFDEGNYDAKTVDTTLPDEEGMKKLAGDKITAFAETMGYDASVGVAAAPKKRAASGGGATKKKVKKEDGPALTVNDIEKLAASGGLKKKTVPMLKAMLKTLNKSATGKKAELIERIEEHFE